MVLQALSVCWGEWGIYLEMELEHNPPKSWRGVEWPTCVCAWFYCFSPHLRVPSLPHIIWGITKSPSSSFINRRLGIALWWVQNYDDSRLSKGLQEDFELLRWELRNCWIACTIFHPICLIPRCFLCSEGSKLTVPFHDAQEEVTNFSSFPFAQINDRQVRGLPFRTMKCLFTEMLWKRQTFIIHRDLERGNWMPPNASPIKTDLKLTTAFQSCSRSRNRFQRTVLNKAQDD